MPALLLVCLPWRRRSHTLERRPRASGGETAFLPPARAAAHRDDHGRPATALRTTLALRYGQRLHCPGSLERAHSRYDIKSRERRDDRRANGSLETDPRLDIARSAGPFTGCSPFRYPSGHWRRVMLSASGRGKGSAGDPFRREYAEEGGTSCGRVLLSSSSQLWWRWSLPLWARARPWLRPAPR